LYINLLRRSQLIDYITHLRYELWLSTSTINNKVVAVEKFYNQNEIKHPDAFKLAYRQMDKIPKSK